MTQHRTDDDSFDRIGTPAGHDVQQAARGTLPDCHPYWRAIQRMVMSARENIPEAAWPAWF
jgi:hypothetical protein